MENKKYELLENDTIVINDGENTLYRIKAIKDFGDVKAGDIGGYIESKDNLSHEGDCWVYGDARVYGDAEVFGNARIYDNVRIYGNARVSSDAWVSGNATIYDNARVSCNARVSGNAWVYDNAEVCGDARIYGNARAYGNAWVSGNAWVYDNAEVCGDARVTTNARVSNGAYIDSINKHMVMGPLGSRWDYTTFYLDNDTNIWVNCGCFNGSVKEFEKAVNETHKNNELYRNQYLNAIYCIKKIFS